MAEHARDLLSRLGPGAHAVQFYEDETFLADVVVRYLHDALRRGHACVVIATEAHRAAFQAGLRARGHDLDGAVRVGRLVLLDARATLARFLVGGRPDAERFFDTLGAILDQCTVYAQVHAYGEMVDLLVGDGNPAAAKALEALWNQLLARRRFALLCGYSLGRFPDARSADDFAAICDAHEPVIPTERFTALDDAEARRREISRLQQRAHALEHELVRRVEAERRKDEFLAMLGHELRNPLAPIMTALQLMKLRGIGADREQQVIQRQVEHLSRLVDDLLDVSRITRGKVELERRPIELHGVVAKAAEMASPLLEQRSHRLTVEVPRRGLQVEGDEVRLAQVIANLLTNAAKYTDPGGHVRIEGRRDGDQVALIVEDDGIGIAAEMLPRIFELFVQGDRELDRRHGGLGLGLALARSLVELHGGTIAVESAGLGQGSRFTVALPAVATTAAHAATAPDLPLRADLTPQRILVVDDNVDAAELMAELLRRTGHQVAIAHDGPSALAIAPAFAPEAALIDIGLPVMDGFEVAARLRAATEAPLRLVAVTGYGQDGDRARSHAAGFDEHLVKPVGLDALIAALTGTASGAGPERGPARR